MTKAPARFERVGHRGAPRERTENTLPGFLLALDRGADAVELDAHVTHDGEVVVHHDPTVKRQVIARTTWRDLSQIDLGNGDRIPRLREVLDAVGKRATVYIELKGIGIEDQVIDVAREFGNKYALHSFDHNAIARVAQKAHAIARAILPERGITAATPALRRS